MLDDYAWQIGIGRKFETESSLVALARVAVIDRQSRYIERQIEADHGAARAVDAIEQNPIHELAHRYQSQATLFRHGPQNAQITVGYFVSVEQPFALTRQHPIFAKLIRPEPQRLRCIDAGFAIEGERPFARWDRVCAFRVGIDPFFPMSAFAYDVAT